MIQMSHIWAMPTFDAFNCPPTFKVAVPNPPKAGGLQQVIDACSASPDGFIPFSVGYSGPVHNAADWQHV